eukprot:CAMPEP_0172306788 /NCGR_PEP_ID=MMETSP1058-20130122/7786_1 /TAXON_ID=83371 /ORGANISM="Detonula confervacea, Strain CCMP 353" /LENGTH=572 /DNA_ID=CAMNT_0013018781 /DNA_START=135 /DNA_END=1853 /DNA_ORIENTATION=+
MATVIPSSIAANAAVSAAAAASRCPPGTLPSNQIANRAAQLPSTFNTSNNASATAAAALEARQKALQQTSTEDERRMRFLALLCGRGAFKSSQHINNISTALSRERSGSEGGMGMPGDEGNKGRTANNDLDGSMNKSLGKGGTVNNETVGHAQTITSTTELSDSSSYQDLPYNYQPTTPSNLSRRLLHKSGVGYLDDSIPLLLSALSDRFLATVLVQGRACRDRRLEGYKALLKERRRRKRHCQRVSRERKSREKRFMDELGNRRRNAEGAIHDAKELEQQSKKSKGVSAANATSGMAGKGPMYQLSEKEREAAVEYKKQAKDVDAEESYYNAYYGKNGEDGKNDDIVDDNNDMNDSEEEDESEEELELEDATQYDLSLRDLVRPLSAWGFDLTGKLGFADEEVINSDDEEYEIANDADNADGGDQGSEEDEDDDQQDGNDEAMNSEEDDADLATTDDEGGGGDGSKKKKKATVVSPKKKIKKKKTAAAGGGGTKKAGTGGDGGSTKKKTTTKRKRDDTEDGGSSAPNKVDDGKPKAKKPAFPSANATEVAKKTETAAGAKGPAGDAKKNDN